MTTNDDHADTSIGTSSGGVRGDSGDGPSITGRTMGGRYRLGAVLGEGGMGTVHAAIELTLGRPVAVKVLKRGIASDETQIARFEREARAAARLAHPNVIGVTELVRDAELGLGLVMEQLSGESLASRLQRGPLDEGEAVSIFTQALDGLAAAHAAGMIHRDLKPSNIFLVPLAGSALVKLLDFGIVKLTEEGPLPKLTRMGALIGTPTYMSPEQVACEPVDATSDVYSIGACLYEALVGQPPYDAPHSLALVVAVGAGPPRDLRELDPRVSPDLVHVVRVAMARDPQARYQSAEAMRAALERAVVGPPRVPRPTAPARTVVTPPDSRRDSPRDGGARESPMTMDPTISFLPWWRVAVAAGLVIALVGGLIWFGSRSPAGTAPNPERHAEPAVLEPPIAEPPSALEAPPNRSHRHPLSATPVAANPPEPAPVSEAPVSEAATDVPDGIDPPERRLPSEPERRRRVPEPAEPAVSPPEPAEDPSPRALGESVLNPFGP